MEYKRKWVVERGDAWIKEKEDLERRRWRRREGRVLSLVVSFSLSLRGAEPLRNVRSPNTLRLIIFPSKTVI